VKCLTVHPTIALYNWTRAVEVVFAIHAVEEEYCRARSLEEQTYSESAPKCALQWGYWLGNYWVGSAALARRTYRLLPVVANHLQVLQLIE
jgi:hypothetical protein